METLTGIAALRERLKEWRRDGETIGLVPTMGNLHAGHISLVDIARQHATRCVATVFVNPTQFGPNEDFDSYPRTLEGDSRKLAAAGVDLMFSPPVSEVYPWMEGQNSAESGKTAAYEPARVVVPGITGILCGTSRPGHFDGVSSVVSILFNLIRPDVAVFGKKDYQQLAVIRKMVSDLHFPVTVIGGETRREADGLAMSSRNQYLSDAERRTAPLLRQVLQEMAQALERGARDRDDVASLVGVALQRLAGGGFRPDYLEVRQASLAEMNNPDYGALVVLAAAWLGRARLIDNIEIPATESPA